MRAVVPRPGAERRVKVPPIPVTSSRQSGSPSPVPGPGGLVENGAGVPPIIAQLPREPAGHFPDVLNTDLDVADELRDAGAAAPGDARHAADVGHHRAELPAERGGIQRDLRRRPRQPMGDAGVGKEGGRRVRLRPAR